MRRAAILSIMLAILAGLVGTSFSVCQGFMAGQRGSSFVGACSSDDFCQRMCRLGRKESPAVVQKASPKITSTGLVVSLHQVDLPRDIRIRHHTHTVLLQKYPPCEVVGEVYLLNSAFLI